ncbi:MAG: DNA polymerase III subunit alpha [Clostridiales bacterium]|jgi:DNA polymerase-3 subunit alpha|nr:DNA polymerase III subunit alpha [Clostridiales bacterium]
MDTKKFTHLHVHSQYSLLDGSAKIPEIISRVKELGMDSVAITDHGVMYGVIDFYKEAKKQGVKPILGCEIYVASGSRLNKDANKDNYYYHLVLLAENETGYHNLIKLVSFGFTDGFYYKPRVDLELLREHKEGLIALSACVAGPVSKNLLQYGYAHGLAQAKIYKEIFGANNFFIELQDHGLANEKTVNPLLIKIAGELNLQMVCTNDSHYINRADAKAHEVLLCIQTGKTMQDDDRMNYETDELYIKSPDEMYALFPYAREALENTAKIAERCNIEIEFNNYKLPKFELPEGTDSFGYLKSLCEKGILEKYGAKTEEIEKRLNYELGIINSMGFVDYFLVVWDFIRYAKEKGIIVGPGRGSSAGSIVTYSLSITNIDPLKYNLIFERFLNPERISMPDIDIDFCYERRQEVINYVVEKYGADHVAQIITFGTMAARACTRDVGRALGYTYSDVDRIAKMIPFAIGMTIEKALEANPELKAAYDTEEETKTLLDFSLKLEGLPRHASTHAAGVVICNKPINEYVPLNVNDGVITTQFPMNTIEELGLLKMDFLGLRTLTVIQNARLAAEENNNIKIDMDRIDYGEKPVYDIISQAKTEGVFQLESAGMKSFMKDLAPSSIMDIMAGISLYRPGPMQFIPKYIQGKRFSAETKYIHKSLEPILKDTYGCIVYQEQVMQIVRDLAGYSLARSDLVRRAMSKKKTEVMVEERKNFIYGLGDEVPGCIKNGIPLEAAEEIFNEMEDFAKYAFPKPHAAAYAVIGYQTAWLKVHFPTEFMAALLTSVMDFAPKISEYISECKKMGITVQPPDINEGDGNFRAISGRIRFGLSAIKNVGRGFVKSLVDERRKNGKYKSLTDLVHRLTSGDLNKRCIESLIKAGAFDSLGGKRSQYMKIYADVMNSLASGKKKNVAGQLNLFDMGFSDNIDMYADDLPKMEEFDRRFLLESEKEILGLYLSGHPLEGYLDVLNQYSNSTSLDFIAAENPEENPDAKGRMYDGKRVSIGGIVAAKSVKYTKNNKMMAFITLEDAFGTVEVIIFPNVYENFLSTLSQDSVILVEGRASLKEDENAKIVCDSVKFYDELNAEKKPDAQGKSGAARGKNGASQAKSGAEQAKPGAKSKKLWIKITPEKEGEKENVLGVLSLYPGNTPVALFFERTNKRELVDKKYFVAEDNLMYETLAEILGDETVKMA